MEQEYKYIAEYLHDCGIRYVLTIEGIEDDDAIVQAYDTMAGDSVLRSVTNQNGREIHVG